VVCSFGLSDIDDLDGTLANTHRLLRHDGVFAFSILHPCFAGGAEVSASRPGARWPAVPVCNEGISSQLPAAAAIRTASWVRDLIPSFR
jgi:hypothetical protein